MAGWVKIFDSDATLDLVSDVTVTSITSGEMLAWTGAAWENQTLAELGIAGLASPTFTGTVTIPILDMQAGHIDIEQATAPANPAASHLRMYMDSADGKLKVRDSGGTATSLMETGGGSSPLTTKGDLYGYSTADARLPVGTNWHILMPDSSETLGVRWAGPTDMPGFGSSFEDGDSLLIHDASDTGSGWDSIDCGTLFDAFALRKSYTSDQNLQAGSDGTTRAIELAEFAAGSGGPTQQDELFRIIIDNGASGTEKLLNVRSSVTAPGVYVCENEGEGALYIGTHLDLYGLDAAPSTPASGRIALYAKSDDKLYMKIDTGDETEVSGSGWDGTAIWAYYAKDIESLYFDSGAGVASFTDPGLVSGVGAGKMPYVEITGQDNGNQANEFAIMLPVPPNYTVADHSFTVIIRCALSRATGQTSYIDIEGAYEAVDPDDTAGSDINATGEQAVTTTYADKTFTITDTGFTNGDPILLNIITKINDSGGGGGEPKMRIVYIKWRSS